MVFAFTSYPLGTACLYLLAFIAIYFPFISSGQTACFKIEIYDFLFTGCYQFFPFTALLVLFASKPCTENKGNHLTGAENSNGHDCKATNHRSSCKLKLDIQMVGFAWFGLPSLSIGIPVPCLTLYKI